MLNLSQQAYKVEVSGRMKEIYSLWHKMETKKLQNLDDVVDVVALRVVITPHEDDDSSGNDLDKGVWMCYHALGLVQHLPGFVPVPTRVKDYISFPKPNGYQSLHTALILNGQTVEVQIRTQMMHQVAEYGELIRGVSQLHNCVVLTILLSQVWLVIGPTLMTRESAVQRNCSRHRGYQPSRSGRTRL